MYEIIERKSNKIISKAETYRDAYFKALNMRIDAYPNTFNDLKIVQKSINTNFIEQFNFKVKRIN